MVVEVCLSCVSKACNYYVKLNVFVCGVNRAVIRKIAGIDDTARLEAGIDNITDVRCACINVVELKGYVTDLSACVYEVGNLCVVKLVSLISKCSLKNYGNCKLTCNLVILHISCGVVIEEGKAYASCIGNLLILVAVNTRLAAVLGNDVVAAGLILANRLLCNNDVD